MTDKIRMIGHFPLCPATSSVCHLEIGLIMTIIFSAEQNDRGLQFACFRSFFVVESGENRIHRDSRSSGHLVVPLSISEHPPASTTPSFDHAKWDGLPECEGRYRPSPSYQELGCSTFSLMAVK